MIILLIYWDADIKTSDFSIGCSKSYSRKFSAMNKKSYFSINTAQKVKFYIKDFFIKFDQIRSKLRIWSNLLKKSLTENFIFCAVLVVFALP